ncbi:MAG: PD-(D/E)XK motif protein [Candidatus Hydrogenedentes bacterium]|nr:PD-(D/E)XK motif protein [Candidatus Hydrogenedentota bacterium]
MLDLNSIFDSLAVPTTDKSEGFRFSALPIPGLERHRLGKSVRGEPTLLIAVADAVERGRPVPIALEHLAIQHDMDCRIARPDGSVENGQFTVVRCVGADQALSSYFLRVASALVASLGEAPLRVDVSKAIDGLVELFRAMKDLPRKSIQGLWAELFVIARAHDPGMLVKAWHATPGDRYDFSLGLQRVEVKSTASRLRRHYFTIEQLHPPRDTVLVVVSLFVERAGAGLSIVDLVDEIRSHLSGDVDLAHWVDRVVALTLGEDWRLAEDERFDNALAQSSLACYEPVAIPRLDAAVPLGVSEVRFRSDLTNIPSIPVGSLRSADGLIRALMPRRRAG